MIFRHLGPFLWDTSNSLFFVARFDGLIKTRLMFTLAKDITTFEHGGSGYRVGVILKLHLDTLRFHINKLSQLQLSDFFFHPTCTFSIQYTPARALSISGLKSRVLKLPFLT